MLVTGFQRLQSNFEAMRRVLTAEEVQRYVIVLIDDSDVSISRVGCCSLGICANGAQTDVLDVGCCAEVVSYQGCVCIE